jgi:HK97 family phage portal protein
MDGEITKYPYRKSDLVFVCISTTARAISQVPLKVMRKTGSGWEWSGEKHPTQILLSKPNPMMGSAEELISSLISYLMLDGHVFLVPYPPSGKFVDSLWVVRRENMDVLKDDRSNQVVFWIYKPGSTVTLPLMPTEIGSIKFFNPYDPVWGFAPLEAGSLPLLNDYKAASYTSQFWDQGAVPGGVLQTEKHLTEDRVDRIRKQFLSEHEGYRKSHKVAVLEGGLKYQQIGLSQKDMEFIDLRKYNRDNILQIFGMKKAVISVTEDLNYATAKEERKEWWQDTNMPLMKLVEASLTNILFPGSLVEKIVFDISTVEALHDDYTKRVEIGEILMKIGFTANEINERLELGFQPRPWRDNWYMPVNMVPMTDDGPEPISQYPPPQPGLPGSTTPAALPPPPPKEVQEEEVFEVKALEEEDQDKIFQGYWKALMDKTEPLEMEFASKVRRCFFDMRKKTLSLLNKKSTQDVLNESFLEDKTNLMKWTVPIYEKSARTGATSLADQTGIQFTFNLNDPEVLHFLTSRPLKVRHVVDTIKNQIAGDIHSGMEKNEPVAAIAGRIKNTFNQAQTRAMTIARTEVGSSLNFGRSKGVTEMAKHGFTRKIWVTAGDEVVRETHKRMNGIGIGITEPWHLGGASLRFPADPNGLGKEVINCRCIEVVDEKSRTQVPIAEPSAPAVTPAPAVPTEFTPTGDFKQDMTSLRAWMKNQTFFTSKEKLETWTTHLKSAVLGNLEANNFEPDDLSKFDVDLLKFRTSKESNLGKRLTGRNLDPAKLVRFQNDIKELGCYMPVEVEKSVAACRVSQLDRKGRAYYQHTGGKEIHLFQYDKEDVLWHEFGHHIETSLKIKNQTIHDDLQGWLKSRSKEAHGSPVIKPLHEVTRNSGYRVDEEAWINDFIHPYVGKYYPNATEVLSMGIQNMRTEKTLHAFMQRDFRHFSLTYGYLAGVL